MYNITLPNGLVIKHGDVLQFIEPVSRGYDTFVYWVNGDTEGKLYYYVSGAGWVYPYEYDTRELLGADLTSYTGDEFPNKLGNIIEDDGNIPEGLQN